jgi:hypothetical protein
MYLRLILMLFLIQPPHQGNIGYFNAQRGELRKAKGYNCNKYHRNRIEAI